MKLVLKDGIEVKVGELHQWGTYNGVFDGYPTDKSNERTIEQVIKRAQEMCNLNKYHVIEPKQTPIKVSIENYPFGTPMHLPSVVCIAEVSHDKPVRDKEMHGSLLILIWFQEEYCFPVDVEILEEMKEVDWVKHAWDFQF